MAKSVIDQIVKTGADPLIFHWDYQGQTRTQHEPRLARAGYSVRRADSNDSLVAEILMHDPQDIPSLITHPYEDFGTEALAWYQSHHHWGKDWGIYFDVNAVARFVEENDVGSDSSLIMWILHHERFHFLVEYACDLLGYVAEVEHYGTSRNDIYRRLSEEKKNVTEVAQVEEAMANAYALTRKYPPPEKSPRMLRRNLCAVCDSQPAGYKDYRIVSTTEETRRWSKVPSLRMFNHNCSELYTRLSTPSKITFQIFKDLSKDAPTAGSRVISRVMMTGEKEFANVPVYLCFPTKTSLASPSLQLMTEREISIETTDRFQKSLLKISKKYPWIEHAWNAVTMKLANRTFNSAHIQKWPKDGPNSWHVRVSNNRSPAFRAHLIERGQGQPWVAKKIGTHKEMGHG